MDLFAWAEENVTRAPGAAGDGFRRLAGAAARPGELLSASAPVEPPVKHCPGCDKPVSLVRPLGKRGRLPTYCTRACQAAHNARVQQDRRRREAQMRGRDLPAPSLVTMRASCVVCAAGFSYEVNPLKPGPARKTCSAECKRARGARCLKTALKCETCGAAFAPRHTGKFTSRQRFCSLDCRRFPERRRWESKRDADRAYNAARKRRLKMSQVETVSAQAVFERDGWVCGICGEPVDPALKYPDRMAASLDHIRPLAFGGEHSVANCQCTHLICNSRKTHYGWPGYRRGRATKDRTDAERRLQAGRRPAEGRGEAARDDGKGDC